MTVPGSADERFCPVIDISQFHSHNLAAAVREACEKNGCFTIVNHGVPLDLLKDLEALLEELFALPAEVKERAIVYNPDARSANNETFDLERLPDLATMQKLHDRLWPEEGNPNNVMRTFISSMTELHNKMSKIFLATLNLDVKSLFHSDFEKCYSFMGINHYTPKDKQMDEEVMHPHTDIGCFSMLYTNNTPGLQVKSKEGKWLDVIPVPYSFVVMASDLLKVWTNGRFHSTEHRVVYKGWKERISVAYAVLFSDDLQILAPSDLVDDKYPRRYKPFTFQPFKEAYYINYKTKEQKLERFVDVFAGI
ncbi:hypothetical protein SUGI_1127250 [Cryptomeria japonica]|nr:hypothetical protein SUGI_1127250 [Cryptomeria japonica]